MGKKKTIAEHAADILRETDNPAVMWGDCGLLDMIYKRAEMKPSKPRPGMKWEHPWDRHARVLNALERSPLFEKRLVEMRWGRSGQPYGRKFVLRKDRP